MNSPLWIMFGAETALAAGKCQRLRLGVIRLFLMSICALTAFAQENDKAPLVFHGKVEQLNSATKRLTVHSEPVAGWMSR